jgi:hypothetical protein
VSSSTTSTTTGVAAVSPGECRCFLDNSRGAGRANELTTRFVGLEDSLFTQEFLWQKYLPFVHESMGKQVPDNETLIYYASRIRNVSWTPLPVIVENWHTGNISVQSLRDVPSVGSSVSNPELMIGVLCFCDDGPICDLSGKGKGISGESNWVFIGKVSLDTTLFTTTTTTQAKGVHRLLQQTEAYQYNIAPEANEYSGPPLTGSPEDDLNEVVMVWGLDEPRDGGPIPPPWEFNASHAYDFSDPWAQRQLWAVCMGTPPDLHVIGRDCWIADFRRWLLYRGLRFPVVENFYGLFNQFLDEGWTGDRDRKAFFWMDNDVPRATYFIFRVEPTQEDFANLTAYREKWEDYVNVRIEMAPATMAWMWHSSRLWGYKLLIPTGTVEGVVLLSLLLTMCPLVCGTCCFGMACSCAMAFTMACTFATISLCVHFVLIVVMGWEIGALEAIALVSLTCQLSMVSLRIAHKYSNAVVRMPRVHAKAAARQSHMSTVSHSPHRKASLRYGVGGEGDMETEGDVSSVAQSSAGGLDPEDLAGERFERAHFALRRVGPNAITCCGVAIGSGLLMYQCTLRCFSIMGAAMATTAPFVLLLSLMPLPAFFMCLGPTKLWRDVLLRHLLLRRYPAGVPGDIHPNQTDPGSILRARFLRWVRRLRGSGQPPPRHEVWSDLFPLVARFCNPFNPALWSKREKNDGPIAEQNKRFTVTQAPNGDLGAALSRQNADKGGHYVLTMNLNRHGTRVGGGRSEKRKQKNQALRWEAMHHFG